MAELRIPLIIEFDSERILGYATIDDSLLPVDFNLDNYTFQIGGYIKKMRLHDDGTRTIDEFELLTISLCKASG